MTQPTMEQGSVYLPSDLSEAMRTRVRETMGQDIAEMPFGMLMRYLVAIIAGLTPEQASRYSRPLPRGRSKTEKSYPKVADLIRR